MGLPSDGRTIGLLGLGIDLQSQATPIADQAGKLAFGDGSTVQEERVSESKLGEEVLD